MRIIDEDTILQNGEDSVGGGTIANLADLITRLLELRYINSRNCIFSKN